MCKLKESKVKKAISVDYSQKVLLFLGFTLHLLTSVPCIVRPFIFISSIALLSLSGSAYADGLSANYSSWTVFLIFDVIFILLFFIGMGCIYLLMVRASHSSQKKLNNGYVKS